MPKHITPPPAEQRCGDCALWGTDKQDDERVDGLKYCPKWHCWTSKGLGTIHDCFVEKDTLSVEKCEKKGEEEQ